MMKHRGGIIYLKKLLKWSGNNYGHPNQNETFGFLQDEITEA